MERRRWQCAELGQAVSVAANGPRKAVGLVTSRDTKENVRTAAVRLARETAAADAPKLIAAQEAAWSRYWSASGVRLADPDFQAWWYRMDYMLRCDSKPGVVPAGLWTFQPTDLPNGMFYWPLHGYDLAESVGVAAGISEFLLQSVGNTIRVFPCWPKDKDAAFTNLRAQGGFLVSAEQKAGPVVKLEITSTVGGMLRVLNPWTGRMDERQTSPGEVVNLSP